MNEWKEETEVWFSCCQMNVQSFFLVTHWDEKCTRRRDSRNGGSETEAAAADRQISAEGDCLLLKAAAVTHPSSLTVWGAIPVLSPVLLWFQLCLSVKQRFCLFWCRLDISSSNKARTNVTSKAWRSDREQRNHLHTQPAIKPQLWSSWKALK